MKIEIHKKGNGESDEEHFLMMLLGDVDCEATGYNCFCWFIVDL
jgi:hypothetical protein